MVAGKLKPPHGIRLYNPREVDRQYIEMRDGIKLYLELFRPDAPGKFPTILSRNPYHGTDIPPQTRDKSCHRDFVSRGYAVVEAEVRGTGISEGKFRFLHNDGNDGYDTILWILQQPWCDGNIGMTGLSYLSMDQFAVAGRNPPGLKAMFAGVGGADIYRDMVYPGGILSSLSLNWAQRHIMRIISPWVPKLRNISEPIDPRIYEMQEKVHGQRARIGLKQLQEHGNLYDTDYLTEWIDHPTDGPFWREQSPYNFFPKIKTPIYCLGGWFDLFTGGVIRTYLEIDAPKKLLIGPWFHGQNHGIDLNAVQLRWFDHWLKGIANGIMEEAPIMYYVMGLEEWRLADRWPPETKEVRYFLRSGDKEPVDSLNAGRLSVEPPNSTEEPDPISHDPDDPVPSVAYRNADISRGEKSMLTYTTEPLEHDLEIAGSIRLHLAMSTTAKDVDWAAKVTEVLPNGESIILTSCAMRASHHKSHESPENLVPGKIYEMPIELPPTCKVFKKGSRIRLSVANSDFPLLYPNPLASKSTVYHGVGAQSYVILPLG